MRRAARSAHAIAVLVLIAAACGDDKPPLANENVTPPPVEAGSGFVSEEAGPPLCGKLEDGGPCGCLELDFLTDVPNVYFVLDRSGSMLQDGKWDTIRSVLSGALIKLGPRIRYGAAVFPQLGTACGPGAEVMGVRQGDRPAGTIGPVVKEFSLATGISANGGTPTASTLTALTPGLRALQGRTFVVLATDGGPNCNESNSCDVSQCIPNIEGVDSRCQPGGAINCCAPGDEYGPGNCLDSAATESAVAALQSAGISTFVMGVPGSAPYAALLDRVATAGGTARPSSPLYYRVDSSDAAAFEDAVRAIAAKVTARCDLPIDPPPADPDRVNVYFDEVVLPADPVNGWVLDGNTINLVGTACNRVLSGEVLNLRVIGGCPTVKPR